LWANGLTPGSDGLTFEWKDFDADGARTSAQGGSKVATKLFEFFESDASAQHWFISQWR